MHLVGPLHVGRAFADHGLAADQCGLVRPLGFGNRRVNCSHIMPIDARYHVPAIGFKALWRVVLEPALDLAIDRDAVIVIQHDQFRETQGTRQRADFMTDALHQATVAEEHVGVVVNDVKAGLVETCAQQPLG